MRRRKPSGKGAVRGLEKGSPRRDARGAPFRPERNPAPGQPERGRTDGRYWIYGHHAVRAALANPRRRLSKLLLTAEAEAELVAEVAAARGRLGDRLSVARATREELADRLGREAVHQGIAVEAWPLPSPALEIVLAGASPDATLLVLDQVTDPHNVGAILRSAAAFAAAAVIVTQHHSPPETGSLAKAASGGLEQVPLIRVANLAQALQSLKKAGFWCLGLAAEGADPLASANLAGRIALVLGAEGGGLRRLTREQCDLLVRLPTQTGLVQLNVSNAAAIALYERARDQSGGAGEPDPA
jgi:23S rRNA (guanosine2251-2'-O)-methyltransferase